MHLVAIGGSDVVRVPPRAPSPLNVLGHAAAPLFS